MSAETVRTAFKVFGTAMFAGVGGGFVYIGVTQGDLPQGIAAGVLAVISIALVWWKG